MDEDDEEQPKRDAALLRETGMEGVARITLESILKGAAAEDPAIGPYPSTPEIAGLWLAALKAGDEGAWELARRYQGVINALRVAGLEAPGEQAVNPQSLMTDAQIEEGLELLARLEAGDSTASVAANRLLLRALKEGDPDAWNVADEHGMTDGLRAMGLTRPRPN